MGSTPGGRKRLLKDIAYQCEVIADIADQDIVNEGDLRKLKTTLALLIRRLEQEHVNG